MTFPIQNKGRPLHVIEFEQSSSPRSTACNGGSVRRRAYNTFDRVAGRSSNLGSTGGAGRTRQSDVTGTRQSGQRAAESPASYPYHGTYFVITGTHPGAPICGRGDIGKK